MVDTTKKTYKEFAKGKQARGKDVDAKALCGGHLQQKFKGSLKEDPSDRCRKGVEAV